MKVVQKKTLRRGRGHNMGFKFNPFTGSFDVVVNGSNGNTLPRPNGEENFSFNYVESGMTLTIPIYQQMIIMGDIDIHGDVDLVGEIVQL